jgi:hypothetical protein
MACFVCNEKSSGAASVSGQAGDSSGTAPDVDCQ